MAREPRQAGCSPRSRRGCAVRMMLQRLDAFEYPRVAIVALAAEVRSLAEQHPDLPISASILDNWQRMVNRYGLDE